MIQVGKTFDIYVMGDLEMFRAALNAVAMVFSGPIGGESLFVSDGSLLHFGGLPALGLLFALFIMLVQKASGQGGEGPAWVGQMLMLVMAFWLMFVPVATVRINDIYDPGPIKQVDNVPLGVVLPIAVMSGITKQITDSMNTAFSTLDATGNIRYMSHDGSGFISPLKALNSLKDAQMQLVKKAPLYTLNLMNFTKNCSVIPAAKLRNFTASSPLPGATKSSGSIDIIQYITSPQAYLKTAWTDFWSLPEGGSGEATMTSQNCGDVALYLQGPDSSLITPTAKLEKVNIIGCGTGVSSAPPPAVVSSKPAPGCEKNGENSGAVDNAIRTGAAKQNISPKTSTDFLVAASNSLKVSDLDASMYMHMVTLSPAIIKASGCQGIPSYDQKESVDCLAFTTAVAQSRADSAASASFFLNIMSSSMNLLQFMFICMTPLVAVVMIVKGPTGFKIASSYLLFGAWASSWQIGAIIIDFYTQLTMSTSTASAFNMANMTYDDHLVFLDAIQKRIGIASDMMAGVPLVMMAIISGSAQGLTALAQRSTGSFAQNFDEKLGTKALANSAPLINQAAAVQNTSPYENSRHAGFFDKSNFGGMGEVVFKKDNQKSNTQTLSTASKAGEAFSQSFDALWNDTATLSTSDARSEAMHKSLIASGMKNESAALARVQNLARSGQFSETEMREISDITKFGIKMGLSPSDFTGAHAAYKQAREKEFNEHWKDHPTEGSIATKAKYNTALQESSSMNLSPEKRAEAAETVKKMDARGQQISADRNAVEAKNNYSRYNSFADSMKSKAVAVQDRINQKMHELKAKNPGLHAKVSPGVSKFLRGAGATGGALVGSFGGPVGIAVGGVAFEAAVGGALAAANKGSANAGEEIALAEKEAQQLGSKIEAGSSTSTTNGNGYTASLTGSQGLVNQKTFTEALLDSKAHGDSTSLKRTITDSHDATVAAQIQSSQAQGISTSSTMNEGIAQALVSTPGAETESRVAEMKSIINGNPAARDLLIKRQNQVDGLGTYKNNPELGNNVAYAYAIADFKNSKLASKDEEARLDKVLAPIAPDMPNVSQVAPSYDPGKAAALQSKGADAATQAQKEAVGVKTGTIESEIRAARLRLQGPDAKNITPAQAAAMDKAYQGYLAEKAAMGQANASTLSEGGADPILMNSAPIKAAEEAKKLKVMLMEAKGFKNTGGESAADVAQGSDLQKELIVQGLLKEGQRMERGYVFNGSETESVGRIKNGVFIEHSSDTSSTPLH